MHPWSFPYKYLLFFKIVTYACRGSSRGGCHQSDPGGPSASQGREVRWRILLCKPAPKLYRGRTLSHSFLTWRGVRPICSHNTLFHPRGPLWLRDISPLPQNEQIIGSERSWCDYVSASDLYIQTLEYQTIGSGLRSLSLRQLLSTSPHKDSVAVKPS